jgi:hypothetical protein
MREKARAKHARVMEPVEAVRHLNAGPDKSIVTEDTFALPFDEPKHEEPPNDPNAPSGSLSSDEEGISL